MGSDPTQRFGNRAGHYAKARPSYPPEVFQFLAADFGLAAGQTAADFGSGTGIFAELLLDRGLRVHAIEPNGPMRAEAEARLRGRAGFVSCDAKAEATGLPAASVDWATAAQAFHWFDPERMHAEVRRILKPGGCCALIWNERQTDTTPFARAYEEFLLKWGNDYESVKATYESPEHIARVLGAAPALRSFPHEQEMDLDRFRTRNQSASYVPRADTPRGQAMMEALDRLFAEHLTNGTVRFDYHANVYCARVH
jgi:ubiquinone/menaquinone biosynthesis C-methylase UbiE